MKRTRTSLLATWFLAASVFCAQAQSPVLPGPGLPTGAGAAYVGPGDIVAATYWHSLRAYSAATAGTKAINLCDHLGANCTDISTSASTGRLNNPGTLGTDNCAVLTTCQIAKIYDQVAASACNGTCDVAQPTGSARPTLTFNCFNGLPCAVLTNASSQFLIGVNTLTAGSATNTFAAVAMRTGSFSSFAGLAAIGADGLSWNASPNAAMLFDGNVNSFTASDSVVHSLIGVFNTTASIGYTDNVATSGLSAGTAAMQGTPVLGQVNGGNNLNGQIFEAGFYKNVLFTPTQAANICHNQFAFWGTSTSC